MSKRIEIGCPGHLIGAASCHWVRHTQIPGYRISSVGDYHPMGGVRETLGAGESDFFETMVFRTTDQPAAQNENCGCMTVADWSEIDGERYATAGEAQAGHERYVRKYLRRKP